MRLVFELRLFAEFQTCYPRRDKRSCVIGVHLTVCTFYISFVNRSFVFKNTCDHPPFLNSRKHFSSEEKREITSNGIQSVFFQRLLRYRQTKIEFQKYPRWEPLLIPPATFIHLKEVLQHSRLGPIHFVMVCFTKEWNLSFQLSHVHPPKNCGLKPLSPKGKCFSIIDVIQLIFSWFTVSPKNENWGFNFSL